MIHTYEIIYGSMDRLEKTTVKVDNMKELIEKMKPYRENNEMCFAKLLYKGWE